MKFVTQKTLMLATKNMGIYFLRFEKFAPSNFKFNGAIFCDFLDEELKNPTEINHFFYLNFPDFVSGKEVDLWLCDLSTLNNYFKCVDSEKTFYRFLALCLSGFALQKLSEAEKEQVNLSELSDASSLTLKQVIEYARVHAPHLLNALTLLLKVRIQYEFLGEKFARFERIKELEDFVKKHKKLIESQILYIETQRFSEQEQTVEFKP